ncbi:MAG: tetratricopeptide repeat protein [Bifidobacteriaceae bacterium]|nr:tetratricopeptide repeat protein [Aeriscardovia sp.]MBQ1803679.1 tetratricopeptide repeat protein [Bifidobacteriaceae bacterium]
MNESEENRKNEQIGISLAGAVDLSEMKARASQKAKAEEGGGKEEGFSYCLDVSFASVESYAPASSTYPILLLIYGANDWGFADDLARAVEKENGKLQLLRIDASKDPSQAATVDLASLPALFAMIKGKLLPLFEGPLSMDASQSLQLAQGSVEAALEAAAEEGVAGTAPMMGKGGKEEKEPSGEKIYSEAEKLASEGKFAQAARAYEKIAQERPQDAQAASKANKAALIARVKEIKDPALARKKAAEDPSDLSSQLEVADLDVYEGHVQDGMERLLDFIANYKDEEGKAKERVLSFISILPSSDPRAKKARMKLANLLY